MIAAMLRTFFTIFVLSISMLSLVNTAALNESFIYNTYKYDTLIDLIVNKSVMQVLDFVEDSAELSVYPTRVHVGTNDTITSDYPLFITASQQKGILSWELPLIININKKVLLFNDTGRTLCPHDSGPNITAQGRPTVTLTTSSPTDVLVRIKLRRIQDFYIEMNKVVNVSVTPSTPKYYYFSFDRDPWNATHAKHSRIFPPLNYTIPKSVLLTIDSDDDVCAIISIQSNSCPVFDNEKDVTYSGYHFTMMRKGGITVTQEMFPRGFYVVFIVKEGDEDCTGVDDDHPDSHSDKRMKHFRLRAEATISTMDYLTGVLAALGLMLLVALLAPIASALSCQSHETITVIEDDPEPEPVPTSSSAHSDAPKDVSEYVAIINRNSSEDSEPDLDNASLPVPLTVARLSRAQHRAHSRRSNRYFSSAVTVAVVYALPVVQLLATYQARIRQSGDQDVCYYNFLCAHPLGPFSDFNHVYSNIGYVVLGVVFMIQIRCREMRSRNSQQELGIPQHHGLLYSMGLALIMEGVLSACYHLCPNKMNFQFDSSFMYVIAVLCMVKLYQNRHPDVNATANTTFMLLAFLMALGVVGIVDPYLHFWVLFTFAHLGVCFYLTLKIYYVGRLQMGPTLVKTAWNGVKRYGRRAFRPAYTARATLLAIANIVNYTLAFYGLFEHNKDFARHLLAILLGNTLLYTLGYVVLKLVHCERLPLAAWLWLVLAHVAWAVAGVFFLDTKTRWSETAAHSRMHNAPCIALVFDSHDLWHLASATALFCSFNALLIMDDPLAAMERHLIPVF